MNRYQRVISSLLGFATSAVVLIQGCAAVHLPEVDEQLIGIAQTQGASPTQIEHGRTLMITSCTECHTAVHPASLSMEKWDRVLPRMIRKAKLTTEDENDIRSYIIAVREWTPP